MAVAAACFRAKLAGQPAPAGERTARVLAGYRRTASDRTGRSGGLVRWAACPICLTGFTRDQTDGCPKPEPRDELGTTGDVDLLVVLADGGPGRPETGRLRHQGGDLPQLVPNLQVGRPGGLQRGRFRPRRRIDNNGGHAPGTSRIGSWPEAAPARIR